MAETLLTLFAIVLYLAVAAALIHRLTHRGKGLNKTLIMLASYLALGLHGILLSQNLFLPEGMDMSFYTIFSLIAWFVTLLIFIASWKEPVENLAIIVLPLAALAVLLRSLSTQSHSLSQELSVGLEAHILLSILAYSLLSMAAVQAILLYIQDAHLHNKQPVGFIRVLPPLETMERLMFRLIGLGFIVLCLSLISGIFYIEDLFSQRLVHKTTLSVLAWLMFAVLLWGRWQYGWRGRTAIRWTLAAFVLLMLAYFGSKFVIELVLQN